MKMLLRECISESSSGDPLAGALGALFDACRPKPIAQPQLPSAFAFIPPKPPRAHFSFCQPPTLSSTPPAFPLLQNKATNCATNPQKTSVPLRKRHFLSALKSFFDETNPNSPARKKLLLIQLKPNSPIRVPVQHLIVPAHAHIAIADVAPASAVDEAL